MTVPRIQEFVYSSWFREIWRPIPMTSGVNWAFKTEAKKSKGKKKERHTIRRKGNLDCDSRQRLEALVARNSMRATLSLKRKHSLEMCPPWESLATLMGPWATRECPNRSTNEQGMLHTQLWPCFNAYICVSFMLSLLLKVPHVLHANDKTEHSYALEKEHSQGLREVNFTSSPKYLEFCKAVWICYWSRLLAYLPMKCAATRRKSTKLDLFLLPTPEEADKTLCL